MLSNDPMSPFTLAVTFLFALEGGFTPDQGGTNRGVTQADYDAWRSSQGQTLQSVKYMTVDEAEQYYFVRWWTPGPYALIKTQMLVERVFQLAVLMGEKESIKVLQRAVGVSADGVFGPKTLAAVDSGAGSLSQIEAWRIEAGRALAQVALANPAKQRDLPGWILRRALI